MTTTGTGQMLGSPAFMAPEQASGLTTAIGPRTDIWAVGATMFTLLTGRLVHEATTVNLLLVSAATKPAPPLASVEPGVRAALAAIVDRALAFDANDRWPNAAAMRDALRTLLEADGSSSHRLVPSDPHLHAGGIGELAATMATPSSPTSSDLGAAARTTSGMTSGARAAAKSTSRAFIAFAVLAMVGMIFGGVALSMSRSKRAPASASADPLPPPTAPLTATMSTAAPSSTTLLPLSATSLASAIEAPPASARPTHAAVKPAVAKPTTPPTPSVTASTKPVKPAVDPLDRQ